MQKRTHKLHIASAKKMLRFLAAFFLLAVYPFWASAWRTDGQAALDRNVSVEVKDTQLKEAIADFARRMPDISFTYVESSELNRAHISVTAKNVKFREVLDEILYPCFFKYTVIKDHIVIWFDAAASEGNKKAASKQYNVPTINIKGMVANVQMAPVSGVSVMVNSKHKIGSTANDGGFVLHNIPYNAALVFTVKGYRPQTVLAKDAADGFLVVQLAKATSVVQGKQATVQR